MKKLKIFLLLSILLCLGFALSPEVHASGPKILQENTYLTFQSTSNFTLNVYDNTKHWDGTLYYSTDTTTWNVWSGTTSLSSVGNKLYLRGTGNTKITGTSSDYKWVLTGSNVECIGNIENLLDWETVALSNHPTMAAHCYRYMFSDCTSLTTAPSLPATTLTDYCYYYMFKGCTSLTTAPQLPATTLAESCYRYMFRDCTSLTTAPSLPATTLADNCYQYMFSGCSSFKVSSTRVGTYQYAWRIPTSGTGTTATNWNIYMLDQTGGTFTDNPSIDTTYYVENPPVSGNAKIFEEDDVLPAGYIKISWDFTDKPLSDGDTFFISGDYLDIEINQFDLPYNGYYIELDINGEKFIGDTPGYTIITLTEPSTIHSFGGPIGRLEDYYEYIHGAIFWEVLPPEYLGDYDDLYDGELLDIEEDYILPQSKVGIKLLYNNTGGSKSGTITYTFGTYGQIILTAQEDNLSTQVTSAEITYNFTNPNWNIYMIDDSLAQQSFGSTRGILFAGVLLDFSWTTEEERTITDITVEGDLDIDVIFTRILTEEELAYQEGYSNGYTTAREIFGWKDGDDWYNGIDAWNLGEKYARELYGFYDSTTDEWLSVDEYVARYGPGNGNGNGSPGASDFYNNFDKYFIPAMIIVFGGAIVLTILKVFKGRE